MPPTNVTHFTRATHYLVTSPIVGYKPRINDWQRAKYFPSEIISNFCAVIVEKIEADLIKTTLIFGKIYKVTGVNQQLKI